MINKKLSISVHCTHLPITANICSSYLCIHEYIFANRSCFFYVFILVMYWISTWFKNETGFSRKHLSFISMYTLIKVVFFTIYGLWHQFVLQTVVYIIYKSALKSALTKSNLFNIVSFSPLLCLLFRPDGKLVQLLCLSMFLKGLSVLLFYADTCFVSMLSVHQVHGSCLRRWNGERSTGTGITDGCETECGYQSSNPSSLQE